MRAQRSPASLSAANDCSTYSRVSTALRPAKTWKESWSKLTPWYSKRMDSSLPGRRPRILNSSVLDMGRELCERKSLETPMNADDPPIAADEIMNDGDGEGDGHV